MRQGMKGMCKAGSVVAAALCVAGCAAEGGGGLRGAGPVQGAAGPVLPRAVVVRRVQEIEALERRRFAAMVAGDAVVLGEVLGETLRYCHSDGHCDTRAQFLEALASGKLRYRTIEVLELEPRVVGTAMVVHGRLAVAVESQGQPLQFRMVFTDAYESTATGWRMVAWQSTRLP